MAAYAALVSLSDTIDRLLNHNRLSISLEENQQLRSLLEYGSSFQAFLEKFPDKFNSLEGRMRELAHEAEDIIEYFMSDQVSSWPKYETEGVVLELKQFFIDINLDVDKIGKMYTGSEEDEPGADGADYSAALSSSSTDPPIYELDAMVGFEDYVIDLKDRLLGEPSKLRVIPICGMAGTGKTTLAGNVCNDPSILDHFVIRVWVTISQYSSVQRILSSLLECLKEFNTDGFGLGLGLGQSDEEKVYQILTGRRYLIVMDNLWSTKAWDVVKKVFPDDSNGSRIMLTTRMCDVASYLDPSTQLYHMSLLNADQSWNLFKKKVFGDEDCPRELEIIGMAMAIRCKGWPLLVVVYAQIFINKYSGGPWDGECYEIDHTVKEVLSSFGDDFRCHPSRKHELHLNKVIQEIDLVAKEVKEIKDSSTNKEVQRGLDSFVVSSSSNVPPIHANSMVGFEEHVMDLKDRLCGESSKLQVIPICGMGGIGKTTLARNVYDDPLIVDHFVIRVWITVSQDYSAQRILSSILESLKEYNEGVKGQSDDEKVHKILMGRRYLVVMDDMWSGKAWDVVRRAFPDDGNASRVMLTTRLYDVASYPDTSSKVHEMSLLNADQSWNLLTKKVFADEDCPSELENIGREIARSCKGLPLAIGVIGGILSMASKNPTSWLEIAENVKSAETAEHDQIEEILSFSYVQLPQYLRPCFLYMGSFPEDHEIRVEKLIRLWVAEGFVKSPIDSDRFEKVAEKCLEELIKRNLVLVTKWKWDGRIKSCSLHDLIRDLCIRKSHESKFFLNVMDMHIGKESFMENIRNQRCVSVDSSNLDYFSSLHNSTIRSIKRLKKHFMERIGKVDFSESVRLLRVLDVEPLDVDYLPSMDKLYELFHLRYLAVTCYGSIPRSLLVLQNLQTLIICGRLSRIRLSWCMPQLRHVHSGGQILFHYPEESTCPLENLQTICSLSPKSCTERTLKLIPNLKRLNIDVANCNYRRVAVCMNNLVHLRRLEDLKIHALWDVELITSMMEFKFPTSLKRLSLKYLKFPWDDIFVVGSLPNLQMLKLKDCTCVGGTWETIEGAFPDLKVLRISDSMLENWITESSHFPNLKHLLLDSCEDLNGIPDDIGHIPTLEVIQVGGNVKASLAKSILQIWEEQEELGNDTLEFLMRFQIIGLEDDNDDDDGDADDDDDGGGDDGGGGGEPFP